jgi:hypothetical protein
MVVSYTADGDSFRADKPRPVAEAPTASIPRGRPYALHPDGQRFAISSAPQETATKQDKVVIVSNFFDEFATALADQMKKAGLKARLYERSERRTIRTSRTIRTTTGTTP